ncbi:transglutaminase domain-containing protein [Caldicellulosiruptor acetigenus I77R1B]|uniref:Transglutaminase domain-containing protein n=1 Tax=Caldicellulosiruptor acetigenus (strain ATCC 700853 / DSM 12137 / I77R1B) TaxID=632335 RepID=E4S7Z8_CALA7|nr:S-layer homology domain-containing protein [Caldicellulosiruptor acetigenus]ADQ41898.1 transglutaminase domain-containing protein [Caldicellulosiruptor acetigenus I77R1B]
MHSFRRMVAVIAIFAFLFSFILPIASVQAAFKDINQNFWAKSLIEKWSDTYQVVKGYSDGTFKPSQFISRAEFVKLLANVIGEISIDTGTNFKDVKKTDWYYSALNSLSRYISGYSDQTFRANKNITREEAAVICAKVFAVDQESNSKVLSTFKDEKDISSWAKSYIASLVEKGYIKGYPDNTFKAKRFITRAEALSILDNMVGLLLSKEGYYSFKKVKGNLVINKSGIKINGFSVEGNVIIAEGVGKGNVRIENSNVNGSIIIRGGGERSVTLENVKAQKVKVDNIQVATRVVISGSSEIEKVEVKESARIENLSKQPLKSIVITNDKSSSIALTLIGNAENVEILSDKSQLNIVEGNVNKVIIQKTAELKVEANTKVQELVVNSQNVKIVSQGDITKVQVNAEKVYVNDKEVSKGQTIAIIDGKTELQSQQQTSTQQTSTTTTSQTTTNSTSSPSGGSQTSVGGVGSTTSSGSGQQGSSSSGTTGGSSGTNSGSSSGSTGGTSSTTVATVSVDRETITVGQDNTVNVTVKDTQGNPIAGKLVSIEGKIGYTNSNGVATITLNVSESKELVINIDGKNYGGLLYAIKPTEGVIKLKLKTAADVYESQFNVKMVGQSSQFSQTYQVNTTELGIIVPVGNDYKILAWKYAAEKGLIYALLDSVNVVNGLNRIVVDTTTSEFVNATLNFSYENNPLTDYELSVANSTYSNVFTTDDVKVNLQNSQINIIANKGAYTIKIAKEVNGEKLYFVRTCQLNTSGATLQFAFTSLKKLTFTFNGLSNLTSVAESVYVKLNSQRYQLSDDLSIYLPKGTYTLDEVEINVYDNNVPVKYLFTPDSSINPVSVNLNTSAEEVTSEVDFTIDEASSSFGVYNINDEQITALKQGSVGVLYSGIKTKSGYSLNILQIDNTINTMGFDLPYGITLALQSSDNSYISLDLLMSKVLENNRCMSLFFVQRNIADGTYPLIVEMELGPLYANSYIRDEFTLEINSNGDAAGYADEVSNESEIVAKVSYKIDSTADDVMFISVPANLQIADYNQLCQDIFMNLIRNYPLALDYGVNNVIGIRFYTGSTEDVMMFIIPYIYEKQERIARRQAVFQKAQEIVQTVIDQTYNDYDKVLALHDYLILHTRYDMESYLNQSGPFDIHTAYGALINGLAVCDGYAKAMYVLLNTAGIESIVVYGEAGDVASKVGHAWNMVKLDGDWYQLDVTWDDRDSVGGVEIDYSYFNVTDNDISSDHWWDKNLYPTCTATNYRYGNYYKAEIVPDAVYYNLPNTVQIVVKDYKGNPQQEKLVTVTYYDLTTKSDEVAFVGYTDQDGKVVFEVTPTEFTTYEIYVTPRMEPKGHIDVVEKLKPVTIKFNLNGTAVTQFGFVRNGMELIYTSDGQIPVDMSVYFDNNITLFGEGFVVKRSLSFDGYDPEEVTVSNDIYYDASVQLHVYDGTADIVGASVYIIDKDTYKELFVGTTGAAGILPLIITKGEYVAKIVYGEGDEDVKNYAYAKLNVSEDSQIDIDLAKFSTVQFIPHFTEGGLDLNDRLYIGFESSASYAKIATFIGKRREAKFAPGDYGYVWIFAHNPYYDDPRSLGYKPTERLVIPTDPQIITYDLGIDASKIAIKNVYKLNPDTWEFESTTLDSVYQGDVLKLNIYIPTYSHYIIGETGICMEMVYNNQPNISFIASDYPYPITAVIKTQDLNEYNLEEFFLGFDEKTDTWDVVLSGVNGDLNSTLIINLPFVPYDRSYTLEFPIRVYQPQKSSSGGSHRRIFVKMLQLKNNLKQINYTKK